ncbi:GGDEF domain-containing protein [Candidatus Aquiluna sp. UB-MaderosW2red]|uniref:sensor domain-containing diguanylate cyclase n=1 Tax=Candidatus Aquiluna sp. UB-MaderosW2red TaxID=1855377 RepID=UPI000875EB31|nr:GGDEF domain-containing protein [Candidatus Aquiluna sp. UB-MaderosW2red]SCX14858.1 diguanylate cyclase (GGDEF) domain-containing protein [Candidatus Aquiluna sp. UB-MaderosW2red]
MALPSRGDLSGLVPNQLDVLAQALNASSDGFAIWKRVEQSSESESEYKLVYMNPVAAAPTGKTPDELVGVSLGETLARDESHVLAKLFDNALQSTEPQILVVEINGENGWVGAFENKVSALSQDTVVAAFRDVSQFVSEVERLEGLIRHDQLTGLLSRSAMEARVTRHLEESQLQGVPFIFGFLDVDDFKSINDNFGHAMGDQVLIGIGRILEEVMDTSGEVARISGDEFAIASSKIQNKSSVENLMEALLLRLRQPLGVPGFDGQVTVSAGVALVLNPKTDASHVFGAADRAMYKVKFDGKAGYKITTI